MAAAESTGYAQDTIALLVEQRDTAQRALDILREQAYGDVDFADEFLLMAEFLHKRAMHPLFEYRTLDGPRKAFDGSIPPEGDGWEANTSMGRMGWDRFGYHEESYWRRRRPPVAPEPEPVIGVEGFMDDHSEIY